MEYVAVYNGDEFVDIDTKENIMEKYHLKETTLDHYCLPSVVRRKARKGLTLFIKLDESEED